MRADDPRHGTTAGYVAGCRDQCCRQATADYARRARARRYLHGPLTIPSLGTKRRLQALVALGYSTRQLDAELGRRRTYTERLLSRQDVILAATAREVAAMYERLSMTLPDTSTRYGKQNASRARNFAKRNGWPPPLAWDDIDNPSERPKVGTVKYQRPKDSLDPVVVERVIGGERLPMTRAERVAVVSKMRAAGHGLVEIESRTGIKKPERYARQGGEAA